MIVKLLFSLVATFFIPPAGGLAAFFLIFYFTELIHEPAPLVYHVGFWCVICVLLLVWFISFIACWSDVSKNPAGGRAPKER